MRVGIGQINTWAGAVDKNTRLILQRIEEARSAGCKLVTFPEYAVPGAFPLDLVRQPSFLADCAAAVDEIREQTHSIAVIVGSVTSDTHNRRAPVLRNCAYVLSNGSCVLRTDKTALASWPGNEVNRFEAGLEPETVSLGSTTVGVSVGEALDGENGPVDVLARQNIEWLCLTTASPYRVGHHAQRLRQATAIARSSECGVVLTNGVGGADGIILDGGSFVVDAEGQLRFEAPRFAEGLFVVDLDGLGEAPEKEPRKEDSIQSMRAAIELGIRDYVRKSGFEKVVIGISGGIDSALVAALAVEALGSDAVIGTYLPCEHSSDESRRDAHALAQGLSFELLDIPAADVHEALRRALPFEPAGIVNENLQARARAVLWMALANERRALVLTTGNKSEAAVGYATLYGDTTGALAPIADLYKGDVFRMAMTFGPRIPSTILEKPPSAELRPNQRDEDDLPPYEQLDALLAARLEENASRDDLIARGFPISMIDDVLARIDRSEFKRRQLPPAVILTDHPLSRRRLPLVRTNQRTDSPHS